MQRVQWFSFFTKLILPIVRYFLLNKFLKSLLWRKIMEQGEKVRQSILLGDDCKIIES